MIISDGKGLADIRDRFPCKGCGEILEEGKAFVSNITKVMVRSPVLICVFIGASG